MPSGFLKWLLRMRLISLKSVELKLIVDSMEEKSVPWLESSVEEMESYLKTE